MGPEFDARRTGFRRGPQWLALVVGIVLAVGAAAQGNAPIRYGGDSDFPPFESLDAKGRALGFQIDLLKELGREIGAEIRPELRPWSETEAAFRSGRVDLVAMVETPGRREWASFAQAHASPAFAIYHRRSRPEPQGIQELAGGRIAVLDSEAMRHTLHTVPVGVAVEFLSYPDAEHALTAAQQGQADAAVLPRAYADRILAAGRLPELVASSYSLRPQSYAFAVAPGNEALRSQIQAGLDALKRDGRLEALRLRWLSSHRGEAERDRLARGLERQVEWTWGVAVLSAVALLLVGAAAWKRGRLFVAERRRRREAEAALASAEELLARAFHRNPQPMLVIERDGGVVRDANDALLALLGVTAEAVVGAPLSEQSHHIDAAALRTLAGSIDNEGGLDATPLRVNRADGAARDCLVSAEPMRIGEQDLVFCIVRDLTDELALDAAMRAGYESLQARLDASRRERDAALASQSRAETSLQEFTRSVSHDLRMPLNAVMGFAGVLRARLNAGHVQEAVKCSDHIERAAVRMNSMITALANLSRVAREPLQRRGIDMAGLARDTWTLLAATQPERRVDCRIDALPAAQADPDLVAQVWQNLLDNAWKYSAKVTEPRVAVDSYRDARGTWYRVTDNGAGFDMEHAAGLFLPFQRMHTAQQFAGTGIGLSLVHRIIEHHDGEIRLRSSPDTGTIAEFTLDAAPADASLDAPRPLPSATRAAERS